MALFGDGDFESYYRMHKRYTNAKRATYLPEKRFRDYVERLAGRRTWSLFHARCLAGAPLLRIGADGRAPRH